MLSRWQSSSKLQLSFDNLSLGLQLRYASAIKLLRFVPLSSVNLFQFTLVLLRFSAFLDCIFSLSPLTLGLISFPAFSLRFFRRHTFPFGLCGLLAPTVGLLGFCFLLQFSLHTLTLC